MMGVYLKNLLSDRRGFTLVEILIALAISGIILAGVYTSFLAQQKSYLLQERITEVQQNLRAAVDMMTREIRTAGFDPTGTSQATILTAGAFQIRFERDITDNSTTPNSPDGDCDDSAERIAYRFANAYDGNNDGVADAGVTLSFLGRASGAGAPNPLAQHIRAIGFAYSYEDSSGQIAVNGTGNVIWAVDQDTTDLDNRLNLSLDKDGNGVLTAADDTNGDNVLEGEAITSVDLDKIRAVRIWILARSSKPYEGYVDTNTYLVGRNIITPNNNYYHRLLETTVYCRNMGL